MLLCCLLAGTFFQLFQENIAFDPYTKAFHHRSNIHRKIFATYPFFSENSSTFLTKFDITQLWPELPLLQSLLYGLVIPSSGRLPVYPQSNLIFQDGFNLFRRTLDNLMSSSSSNRMNNAPNTQDCVL